MIDSVPILLFLIVMALAWIAQKLQVVGEEMRLTRQAIEQVLIDRTVDRM